MAKRRNQYSELAKAARDQLKRAEALGRSLDERATRMKEAADDWEPSEDWRRDFAAVNAAIQHAGSSLVKALEGNQKFLAGLSEDQLDEQLRTELVRNARDMSEEAWQRMVKARATRDTK